MLDYQASMGLFFFFAKFSFFAHVYAVAFTELHQKEVFWMWGFLISAIYNPGFGECFSFFWEGSDKIRTVSLALWKQEITFSVQAVPVKMQT